MGVMDTRESLAEVIAHNLREVRARVNEAAHRVNRNPEEITLLVVTKEIAVEALSLLPSLGITEIGENRVQEAISKAVAAPPNLNWHLVGHLQTNKVKKAVSLFRYIHSIDRLELARKIEEEAGLINKEIRGFIQVNVSGEVTKFGIAPEELFDFYHEVSNLKHLKVIGLMTMAPFSNEADSSRPYFRKLANLLTELQRRFPAETARGLRHLSMGMTQDFEVAIEEGATYLRIGTAIFKNIRTSEHQIIR